MGSQSIAHEAEGRMGYWLRGHEGEIQLVGQKYGDKTTLATSYQNNHIIIWGQRVSTNWWQMSWPDQCFLILMTKDLKLDFNPFLPPKSPRFSVLVGHNI